MSDYHRKQSGFSDDDQAPPTLQAYREKKDQYDSLTKRVNSAVSRYDGLRKKVRSKKIEEKKKPVIDIERALYKGKKYF